MEKCIKRNFFFSTFFIFTLLILCLFTIKNTKNVFSSPSIENSCYFFYSEKELREDVTVNINFNGESFVALKCGATELKPYEFLLNTADNKLTLYKSYLLSLNYGISTFYLQTTGGVAEFTVNIIMPETANYDNDFGNQGNNGWYYKYKNYNGVDDLYEMDRKVEVNDVVVDWISDFNEVITFSRSNLTPSITEALVLQWKPSQSGDYIINYKLTKKKSSVSDGILAYTYKNNTFIPGTEQYLIIQDSFKYCDYTVSYIKEISLNTDDCLYFEVNAFRNHEQDDFDYDISITKKVYDVTFLTEDNIYQVQRITDGSVPQIPEINPVKQGYIFEGWYATETPYNFNSTINAQTEISARFVKNVDLEEIALDILYNGINVNFNATNIEGCQYQFWIKSLVFSDGSDNLNKNYYFWNLIQPYSTAASAVVSAQDLHLDINHNYSVIVRIKYNDTIKEINKNFTPNSINKVFLDTVTLNDAVITDEIIAVNKTNDISINATGNVENLNYNLCVNGNNIPQNYDGVFVVNLSEYPDGFYDFIVRAKNDISYDTKNFRVYIYNEYDVENTPVITSLIGESNLNGFTTYVIKLKYADGNNIIAQDFNNFDICLTSNSEILSVSKITNDIKGVLNVSFTVDYNNKHGVYYLCGKVFNNDNIITDTIIKYYHGYARKSNLTQTADMYTSAINTKITITAQGSITNENDGVLYAFYREDASGWKLIKDYSSTNILYWTPLKAGLYNIQVRIKGIGEGSWEGSETKQYIISGNYLAGDISVKVFDFDTGLENNGMLNAGKPYELQANLEGQTDVLYMFTVYNINTGMQYLNTYSSKGKIMFIPNKADEYIITARAIKYTNFGYMDINQSIVLNSIVY